MIKFKEIFCPKCNVRLKINIEAIEEPLTKEEQYEKRIGELQIICSQLNDEKLNLMRTLETTKKHIKTLQEQIKTKRRKKK